MPNWVDNSISVSGKPEDVKAFIAKAGAPHQMFGELDDRPFSFWNFIRPANLQLEAYESGWYEWNIENWGTKWDAQQAVIDMNLEWDSTTIDFQTAWDTPEPVYRAIAEQHPELSFYIYCQEEQGWGYRASITNGEFEKFQEWDIPMSHKDWDITGDPEGCHCYNTEDKTEWFADCEESR